MSLTSVAAPIWNEIARTQPPENGVGKKGVRDGSGRDGGAGGPGVPGAETTGSAGSGFGILDLKPLLIERRAITGLRWSTRSFSRRFRR